jgi:hypothetical protein
MKRKGLFDSLIQGFQAMTDQPCCFWSNGELHIMVTGVYGRVILLT